MQKRMTISIDENVYNGLLSTIGKRKISKFLEELARPYVLPNELESGYAAMAADADREKDAQEWCHALNRDGSDETR